MLRIARKRNLGLGLGLGLGCLVFTCAFRYLGDRGAAPDCNQEKFRVRVRGFGAYLPSLGFRRLRGCFEPIQQLQFPMRL